MSRHSLPPKSTRAPHELWNQAGGDRDEYRRLMIEHGHIVPKRSTDDRCEACSVSKQQVLVRDKELVELLKRAAPFVNAVAVIALDERDKGNGGDPGPALGWIADAAKALRMDTEALTREALDA